MFSILLRLIYSSVEYLSQCLFYIKLPASLLLYFITANTFFDVWCCLKMFYWLFVSLLTWFLLHFCRQSPGRGSHYRFLQGRPEAGQVWGHHFWPGRREENPWHLEELLFWITWCGVCGGLQWRPEDPGDTGDHGWGPAAPTHRRETCPSVSYTMLEV